MRYSNRIKNIFQLFELYTCLLTFSLMNTQYIEIIKTNKDVNVQTYFKNFKLVKHVKLLLFSNNSLNVWKLKRSAL